MNKFSGIVIENGGKSDHDIQGFAETFFWKIP
jgi:hypothetical protein